MILQGRSLSSRMQGADVRLLQTELALLGFTIPEVESGFFGDGTREAVLALQARHELEESGVVDERTAEAIAAELDARTARLVSGHIRQADGSPLSRVTVRAFDRDLRAEALLGEATTDADGRYQIKYRPAQTVDGRGINLVVRAVDANGAILTSSETLFRAGAAVTVDLVVGADTVATPSEYELLANQVRGVEPARLSNEDVAFLADESGQDRGRLSLFAAAARLSEEARLPAEVFYALLRGRLPSELPPLLAQSPSTHRRALETALRRNLIPAGLASQLDEIVARLQQLFVDYVFRPPDPSGPASLGDLLRTSALSEEQQRLFVRLYSSRKGSVDEFWTGLRQRREFQAPALVDDLRFTLQLGLLTMNNLALVKALQALRQSGRLRTPRDLATLDRATWTTLVTEAVGPTATGIPPDIAGDTPADKIANYVSTIVETLTQAYPTPAASVVLSQQPAIDLTAVRQVLASNPSLDLARPVPPDLDWGGIPPADRPAAKAALEALRQEIKMFPAFDYHAALAAPDGAEFRNPIRDGVARFLTSASDFDFRATQIDSYLAAHQATAFEGIPSDVHAAVTGQLKALQRIFCVAPSAEHLQTLLGEGLDSAFAIANLPPAAFSQLLGPKLGDEQATMYYAKAQQVSATNKILWAGIHQSVTGPTPVVIPSVPAAVKEMPNLTTLFGQISLCQCDQCRSICSPAAYLVDLFQFLDASPPNVANQTPLAVLLQRRPDLAYLKLSCENTNTPLPYVDLVNEILESYVALDGHLDSSVAKDTGKTTAEELSANPQYVNDTAYGKLAEAVYPIDLPFNRPLEVERAYLGQLGSSRVEVMRTFQHDQAPTDLAVAVEALGIAPEEQPIITGTTSTPLYALYGFPDSDVDDLPWWQYVTFVSTLLSRTRIVYDDLVELLKTRFLNPTGAITIQAPTDPPSAACDLTQQTIQNLWDGSEATLSKMHRFIRLWRRLGWSIADLDRALFALHATMINDPLLHKLALITELQSELELPLSSLLSFWADIDTFGNDSPYTRLFQNKAVFSPLDPAFALKPDGSDLIVADADPNLPENQLIGHEPAILAALRIRAPELQAIEAATTLAASAPLKLTNLSKLYRVAVLAKALKLPVVDLIALIALAGIDPFKPAEPSATADFVRAARKVAQSTFSVAQLNYLYRQLLDPLGSLAPSDDEVAQLTAQFQDGLKKIVAQTTVAADPTGEVLRANLLLVLDSSMIEPAMSLIAGTSTASQADQESFIDQHFSLFLDPVEAKTVLLGPSPLAPADRAQANAAYVLTHLLSYLRGLFSRSFVVQALSDALRLDTAITRLLLEQVLKAQIDSMQPAMVDFLALVGDGLSASYFPSADLSGAPVTRIDPTVDFDWGNGPPDPAIDAAAFSARWTGTVLPEHDETYTFYLRASDGVRLWVDGQVLIDQWHQQPPTEHSATIALKAGQLSQIKLEYFKIGDNAVAELRWSSQSTPKQVIPQTQLYSGGAFSLFDQPFRSYYLLHKLAILISGLRITAAELSHLAAHGGDFDGIDLNTLPLERTDQTDQNAVALFAQWTRLFDLFTLRNSLPRGDVGLTDVFAAAQAGDPSNVENILVAATGWDAAAVDALLTGFGLSANDLVNEIPLLRFNAAVGLSRRLGLSLEHLFLWATLEPDAGQAKDLISALRAKYNDDQWLAIGRAVNDPLRERQRAALVAYLLQDPTIVACKIVDSDGLFEYFLIDVDMSACMATSRIKQAISSVQLFVQRCLMNLEQHDDAPESSVSPSAIDADLWKWMGRYRVWEANRKVFLYPENWILPELRDDKTSFFKDLESELLSTDVTADSAEDAVHNYLEKVTEASQLELVGMYWQENEPCDDPPQILHVLGRTRNLPRRYYYRQLLPATGTWTAWEPLGLDIQGEHLIPVAFNRRLYLFWAIFTQKADPKDNPPPSKEDGGTVPVTHWEISLAWSEYRHGRWGPTQTSVDSLRHHGTDPEHANDSERYAFRSVVSDGRLLINVENYQPQTFTPPNGDAQILEDLLKARYVGQFSLDDCTNQMRAVPRSPLQLGNGPLITEPENALPSYMTFAESTKSVGDWLELDNGVLTPPSTAVLLKQTPTRYTLLYPDQVEDPHPPSAFVASFYPFFYQDETRAYLARPIRPQLAVSGLHIPMAAIGGAAAKPGAPVPSQSWKKQLPGYTGEDQLGYAAPAFKWKFFNFFHPLVCKFLVALARTGIPGLLTLDNQRLSTDPIPFLGLSPTAFEQHYRPNTDQVVPTYPRENVDFSRAGAYSAYNWELFFHIPFLIATRLHQNQRFDEARQWFHYIFDPTDDSTDPSPVRYWKVLPFYQNAHPEQDQIAELLALLSYTGSDPETLDRKQAVLDQVAEWLKHPFDPHAVARLRLTAYQKTVVMQYIDNLIAWGDQLFSQDTIEAINEATQLYLLAHEILGPRPPSVPPPNETEAKTYADLKPLLDTVADSLVGLENLLPYSSDAPPAICGELELAASMSLGATFYFCVPQNDVLLGYWDKVADRLYKIRHCMNIEGVVRQLPLFEPPLDPALLVRAAALGVDLTSVLDDVNAPLPVYRFPFIIQKALELCGELRSLGANILSALEKKDAETLAQLRATHETSLLTAVRTVKEQQLQESQDALDAVRKSRTVTEQAFNFYSGFVQRSAQELEHIGQLGKAQGSQERAQILEIAAAVANTIPNFSTGIAGSFGSPVVTMSMGGANVAAHAEAFARKESALASFHTYKANLAGTLGVWARRADDVKLQLNKTTKELDQIDQQITAALDRVTIAQTEWLNHLKQIDDAAAVETFLREKYTSEDLYGWMVSQLSAIYFQTHRLAYDLAKRAERAFRFERGLTTSSFIQFGYWDSLKKGLLAGERLYLDLKRMELAYLDQNRRDYELVKQISLLSLDPMALIALKETGRCIVELPESLFDLDYPGHYMRRIKSVGLTIPAVVGPYTSINCTLTLLASKTRIDSSAQGTYQEQDADARFATNFGAVQSIATSAQNGSGMFELSFRDERYLPFEGAGVVSRWQIDLPKDCNAFDFDTITDVILTLHYSARDGGKPLQDAARQAVFVPAQQNLLRFFSVKHEFPDEWYRFLNSTDLTSQTLAIDLTKDRFPFLVRSKKISVDGATFFLKLRDGYTYDDAHPLHVTAATDGAAGPDSTFTTAGSPVPNLPFATPANLAGDVPVHWTITAPESKLATLGEPTEDSWWLKIPDDGVDHFRLRPDALEGMWIVCNYSVT